MTQEIVLRFRLVVAALGCLLATISIKQLAAAFAVSDVRLIIASSIISISIGVFITVLMLKK